jgi:hypothetical protein
MTDNIGQNHQANLLAALAIAAETEVACGRIVGAESATRVKDGAAEGERQNTSF